MSHKLTTAGKALFQYYNKTKSRIFTNNQAEI